MVTPRSAAARRATPGRTRRARAAPSSAAERRVALSTAERALLLRACARYRSALPSYLASARSELKVLVRLLRKLR